MKKQFLLLAISAMFLLSGCKKEEEQQVTQTCEDFPPPTSGYSYDVIIKPSVGYASFNPNNPQEFSFVRSGKASNGLMTTALWKVNLTTGKQQMLLDEEFWGQPDWGKNNWILLEKPGNQIYKIKSTGDSLTQMPFADVCFNPKWNNSNGNFLHNIDYSQHYSTNVVERSAVEPTYQYVKNPAGRLYIYRFTISQDGTKIVSTGDSPNSGAFHIFDYPSLTNEVVIPFDALGVTDAAWHPDNVHLFWTCSYGLYKTNVITKQTWQLKTGCDSREYHCLDVSPDGQTLAVTVFNNKLLNGNQFETKGGIYLIDTNGNNERELDL